MFRSKKSENQLKSENLHPWLKIPKDLINQQTWGAYLCCPPPLTLGSRGGPLSGRGSRLEKRFLFLRYLNEAERLSCCVSKEKRQKERSRGSSRYLQETGRPRSPAETRTSAATASSWGMSAVERESIYYQEYS